MNAIRAFRTQAHGHHDGGVVRRIGRLYPFGLALAGSLLCVRLNLFERLCMGLRHYEAFQFDELFFVALFFVTAACVWLGQRTLLMHAEVQRSSALERQSHVLARLDPLTGLPNRRAFIEALEHEHRLTSLMLVDLDGFKRVNDEAGHQTGDTVLVEVGARMEHMVASGELLFAARIGGDEFACLCRDDAADRAAARLIASISEPIATVPLGLRVTPSIGIVAPAGDRTGCDAMLRQADGAMYAAKRAGGASARRST